MFGRRTIGQIKELLGGGHIGGDGHIALLGFSDLEESASQRVGVAFGADGVGQLRLGRHDGGVGGGDDKLRGGIVDLVLVRSN